MWRRVGLLQTDISAERVASIFRAEEITASWRMRVIYTSGRMKMLGCLL
jgi:hypothetical protein